MIFMLAVISGFPAPMLTVPQVGAGQNNSLYLRADQEKQARTLRGQGGGDSKVHSVNVGADQIGGRLGKIRLRNVTPVLKASWCAVDAPEPKDFQVHDLLTIVVNEVSKHSVKAEADAEREQSFDFTIQDWIRLNGGNLRPDRQSRGDPKIKAAFDRDFEGDSDIKREDTLSARIQAEIIDVLPNGNLALEATHTVIVDEESTTITLTGTCRSNDIGFDNTIFSSKISGLEIRKTHTGMARDATKRSLVMRLLDFLNPF